ncbi:conjugal transfer protein TrbJ [Vibrio sinensis]|uniref:Conjugal transfer protein TrbJ n=1 Tax=Vibrio sinensis TaxID=2302434 RepID=A0A3A6QK64_9VIBR|nr:type IV secretion system protein [Vibrio sinensis]RJX65842.1 conjugal transfer protein TrbJ [Vibrio sinensis]
MKKQILILLLGMPLSVQATGILTFDTANLAQMALEATTRAKEFAQIMAQSHKEFSEMQAQGEHYKEMVDGHFDFEDLLNDPNLNQAFALEDWKKIYDNVEDIADLRYEFNMYSDDPIMQRRYNDQLRMYRTKTTFYENTVKRYERLSELLGQFNTATTPAAKADLANAISYEQTLIQNDQHMHNALNAAMERQQQLEQQARVRENTRMLLNEGIPRPR